MFINLQNIILYKKIVVSLHHCKLKIKKMIIEKNKVVSLTYDLSIENEVIESVTDIQPLQVIFGTETLLPKFEENIAGLKVGDSFEFEISKDDAYGDFREEYVIDIPKNVFEVEGKIDENAIRVGNSVPMLDHEGNKLTGIILEIGDETIKMDFNHPLAGDNLSFKGKVTDLRDATEEEIAAGLESNSCGCGCDCDEDDCSSDNQAESCGCSCGC